ncbi:unnamed protein product [Blepharisma stoltei]|uniref:Lysozyme n=1 Tax=Blepharisma stoltei TaxID=1481888 RepID=A0AAU9INP8_9CILI|nr:unnamed protein product [Blepharisma stoltei]
MRGKALLILAFAVIVAQSSQSVDTADLGSFTQWYCIAEYQIQSAIVRGYMSSGNVDPNVVPNIQNAGNAFLTVGVYMFPCFPCGNPAKQAQDLVTALKGQTYDSIWIDVETYQWSSNVQANQAFITTLANTLKSLGQSVGIYTSRAEWSTIVGLNWSGVSWAGLWYYHYDNQQNFMDFQPFGGWEMADMKQYHGLTKSTCGIYVNSDWWP